jgi:hypothetical protein
MKALSSSPSTAKKKKKKGNLDTGTQDCMKMEAETGVA